MIVPTRIQLSQIRHQLFSGLNYMIRKASAANVIAGQSVLSHYATMFFFNNQSMKQWKKNIVQHRPSGLPTKNRSTESSFTRPSITLFSVAAPRFFKPIYQNFITRCYFEQAMPTIITSIFLLFGFSYVEATFSIYNASQICPLLSGLICMKNNFLCHNRSFVYNSIALNEKKFHAERLSEKAPYGDAIV